MAPPTVSVLLPVRDAEASVAAAARSVLEGTFEDLELLLVDDGSVDGTPAELARLARSDRRVRVLTTPRRGLVAALELARREAQALEFIARMDADDRSLPERLAVQLEALRADASLWAVGTQVRIVAAGAPVSPNLQAYEAWLNSLTTAEAAFADRLVESPLCHPSVVMRRAALERVGGWKDDGVPEDWGLWLAMHEAGGRLRAVAPVLFEWVDHPARLTRTDPRYGWDALQDLKARHLARLFGGGPALTLWGAGELGLALLRRLRARGVAVDRFIEVHPRKVGQRIEGVPVVGMDEVGPPGPGHLVAAVGARGARAEIRAWLVERGWREGRDFTCAG